MLRSIRALFLFWSIFASYGLQWLLARLFGSERMAARGARVHQRNARRLAQGFTRLRGVFIKLGQVLSVLGGFLPRAYGSELEVLQDQVPPLPFRAIQRRLKEAFGPDALDRFTHFEETPVAAASLAQVHRATDAEGRELAVKVLYPNVEKLIRRDLAVLRTVVPVVRRMVGFPHLGRVLDQLSAMLERETDYGNEARNMARLRKLFADRDDVVVPDVIDELSSKGVLTMSFELGVKITDLEALEAEKVAPEDVARLLVDSYFTMLFQDQVFHADPHPGNFLVRSGPTLVILDHGAVENVTNDLAMGMQMVVMGALGKDDEQILLGLERMGFLSEDGDRELLGRVGRDYLKVLADTRITDFSRMDRETVRKLSGYDQTRGKLRAIMRSVHYPDGFFYVERTLVLLFGLVGRLAPDAGLPGLVAPFAMRAFMQGQGGGAQGGGAQGGGASSGAALSEEAQGGDLLGALMAAGMANAPAASGTPDA